MDCLFKIKFYVTALFQIASWSTCGGNSVHEAVRRIFEGVLDNNLGRQYNWTGQGGKRSFKALCMRTILQSEYTMVKIIS